MKGYAHTAIFRPEDIRLWKMVTRIVEGVPEELEVRCHELAHALGQLLDREVVDGHFGIVEHSWLLASAYTILDPYTPGCLPLVQLKDISHPLPALKAYKPGPARDDIDQQMVGHLILLARTIL